MAKFLPNGPRDEGSTGQPSWINLFSFTTTTSKGESSSGSRPGARPRALDLVRSRRQPIGRQIDHQGVNPWRTWARPFPSRRFPPSVSVTARWKDFISSIPSTEIRTSTSAAPGRTRSVFSGLRAADRLKASWKTPLRAPEARPERRRPLASAACGRRARTGWREPRELAGIQRADSPPSGEARRTNQERPPVDEDAGRQGRHPAEIARR